jgi:hypothetical protein
MTQSVGFAAGAQALADRLASLVGVPRSFSLAAEALATQCRLIENQAARASDHDRVFAHSRL